MFRRARVQGVHVPSPERQYQVANGVDVDEPQQSTLYVSVDGEAARFTVSGPLKQSLVDVSSWVTSTVQRADQLGRTLLDVRRSGTLIMIFYVALMETHLEASVYDVLCTCSAIPTRYQVQYCQSVTKRRMLDLWRWSLLARNAAESMGFPPVPRFQAFGTLPATRRH
jgi:hypothetical protein